MAVTKYPANLPGHPEHHSLPEVYRSISIPPRAGIIKKMLAFAGPAYLVSVGYMDPGNWATDIEAGARFGGSLLWVILLSNVIAIILQTLSARLGLASGRDLAEACREYYPPWSRIPMWLMAEIAIIACDLAEVMGGAVGINLLTGLPMFWCVFLMGLDVVILLIIQHLGMRKLELVVVALVTVVMGCFIAELIIARPDWGHIGHDLLHPGMSMDMLYVAIGIIGATVMPHNLYLHSSIVQTRRVRQTKKGILEAARFNFVDSITALNLALIVNGLILLMAATAFHQFGAGIRSLQEAFRMLSPLLGASLASILFAVALIASGQSSTLTGTLAGQIIMEGFLCIEMAPWIRRLITRGLALGPALAVVSYGGEAASWRLLVLSQVVLSMQLPFAVIPLVQFTSSRRIMGPLANPRWLSALAWGCAALIIALNIWLLASFLLPG